MSFLDRFRAKPKAQPQPSRRRQLSYDSARRPSWDSGAGRASSGPNADMLADIIPLRKRARNAYQNNSHARSAVNTIVRGVIGTGLVPRFGDEKLDALFAAWAETCSVDNDLDFWGLQDVWERTRVVSGEVLVRARWRETSDGYPVPLQLETMECDQLDDMKTGTSNDQGGVDVGGIAFDRIGRRYGAWVMSAHPDDVAATGKPLTAPTSITPYSQLAHYFKPDRPGQVRGVTDLAAILEALQYLADLRLAKMLKLRAESSVVGGVTSDDETYQGLTGQVTDEQNVPSTGVTTGVEEVGVATLYRLRNGESISWSQQTASPDFVNLMQDEERRLAVGIGATYEKLTGNLSTVNYSSYKAGLQDFEESCRAHRENVTQPALLDRVVQWFILGCKMSGKLPQSAQPTYTWSSPARGVDKDTAYINQLRLLSHTASPQEIIASSGRDPMRVLDEWQAWNEACAKRGLDPTIVNPATIAIPPQDAP